MIKEFFMATDGNNWANKSNWGVGDPCDVHTNWYGLGCHNPCDEGIDGVACGLARVRQLILPDNNLVGTILADLFYNLRNLTIVDLAHNELSGTVPTEVGRLRNVRELSLQYNTLSGTAPSELGLMGGGDLRRVRPYQPESNVVATATVNFGSTLISGAIPTEIGLLGALERLDFSHTRAEGHIPDVVGTPLQLLHLQHSRVSGTLASTLVASLTRLRSLRIAETALSGTLPTELLEASRLFDLNGEATALSGTIPTELAQGGEQHYLNLARTRISGTVPDALFNRNSLVHLDLLDTRLSGTLPVSFAFGEGCGASAALASTACGPSRLRYLYIPRELTQPMRSKWCREQLGTPPRFNYFYHMQSAVQEVRARGEDHFCPNPYTVDEAFPPELDLAYASAGANNAQPPPLVTLPPPPPSPLPPGQWSYHLVQTKEAFEPPPPEPPAEPPLPPLAPRETLQRVVRATVNGAGGSAGGNTVADFFVVGANTSAIEAQLGRTWRCRRWRWAPRSPRTARSSSASTSTTTRRPRSSG